jgi:hypothetical protein
MRVGKLLAFVSSALAFLCAPLVAQTIVTNVTALRMGTFPAANALILTEYANPYDRVRGHAEHIFYRA